MEKIDRFAYVGLELDQLKDYIDHTKFDNLYEEEVMHKIGRLLDRALYLHGLVQNNVDHI